MIKPHEVRQAILDLPNGKASGLDGLPHDLWRILLARHDTQPTNGHQVFNALAALTVVYNDIERHRTTESAAFSEGWMCPIYKKNDRTEISNYRPITVLNADYKIFTRVLTNRLSKVAPYLIHPDQAGFMKQRRIEDQTDLIQLMVHTCEADEENGAIVCLDQEKAYDKIAHPFLWVTLEKLDFPTHFINTIKSLYRYARTKVIINGEVSTSFLILHGVRQGDPLSCLLFNLAIESLTSMLRDSTLSGLPIPSTPHRLIVTLFADDTTIFLLTSDDYHTLLHILHDWCQVSGAKFNTQKTVILPIGSKPHCLYVLQSRQLHESYPPIPPSVHIA